MYLPFKIHDLRQCFPLTPRPVPPWYFNLLYFYSTADVGSYPNMFILFILFYIQTHFIQYAAPVFGRVPGLTPQQSFAFHKPHPFSSVSDFPCKTLIPRNRLNVSGNRKIAVQRRNLIFYLRSCIYLYIFVSRQFQDVFRVSVAQWLQFIVFQILYYISTRIFLSHIAILQCQSIVWQTDKITTHKTVVGS